MQKFEGLVLDLKNPPLGMKFSENCDISYSEKVPVYYGGFYEGLFGRFVGVATISKDQDKLICTADITSEFSTYEDVYFVSGYCTNVQSHREENVTVIDSATLSFIIILEEETVINENLRIKRVTKGE